MAEKAAQFITTKSLFSGLGSLAFDIIWMPPGLTGVAPAANWPALLMDAQSKGYFVVDKDEQYQRRPPQIYPRTKPFPGITFSLMRGKPCTVTTPFLFVLFRSMMRQT